MLRAGFDVGGTSARLVVFGEAYEPLHEAKASTRADPSPEGVAALLGGLLEDVGVEPAELASVGVGLAAQLDPDGRRVRNAPNLGWRDVDFVSFLRKHWPEDLPIVLVNDVNALLWGEYIGGAAEGRSHVLGVWVGTGIGGAIISDGRLTTGASNNAGEIGHVKVELPGRHCGCGAEGCLEAFAGGLALERQVAEAAAQVELDVFRDDGAVDLAKADELVAGAQSPELTVVWERAATFLAVAVGNACTLLNPEMLLFGGGVWFNCPTLRQQTLLRLPDVVAEVCAEGLVLADAGLGDRAGVLGAAVLGAGG